MALRPSRSEIAQVLPSALPAAVAGALAQSWVERRLGRPGPTAVLLAGAGVALLVADRTAERRSPDEQDLQVAGAAQVAALAPGVSRAGATLTVLRFRGVRRDDALRASLVMSLPITVGAAALTAARSRQAPALGPSAVAALAAYVTASRVSGSRRFYTGSALYRVALAAAVAARLREERA